MINTWLAEVKEAEQNDDAEGAMWYHRMIAAYYRRCGKIAESNLHLTKAEVYNDEELPKMNFINNVVVRTYEVKLKNADSETCVITVDSTNKQDAHEQAEKERGAGWMAISSRVAV